jgi:lysophospholipase L1-like esterase
MSKPVVAAGFLLSLLLVSCSAPSSSRPPAVKLPAGVIYAALGASETYGIGADDRYRQAWPQVFFNDTLPSSSTLYNFGIPGATTAQALHDELPAALAVHPTVVTVWLNVNDLVKGVPASTYAAEQRQLVHAARQGGKARVLVANVPYLRQLPAYRACLPGAPDGGPACLTTASQLSTPQQIADLISAYNAAIAEVVRQEGATLVDLNGTGTTIAQHPDWISSDGFHPNGLGYAAIAKAFETAYRQG